MRRSGNGAIVNVASIHSIVTSAGMFPYAAAKAGLVGLTKSMALDEAKHSIRVNAISPGGTRTRLVDQHFHEHGPDAEQHVLDAHPFRRIAEPAEIASATTFLLSSEASFITGVNLVVDGGFSVRFP